MLLTINFALPVPYSIFLVHFLLAHYQLLFHSASDMKLVSTRRNIAGNTLSVGLATYIAFQVELAVIKGPSVHFQLFVIFLKPNFIDPVYT